MCKDTYVLLCVVTGITVTNIQVTTIRVTPKEGTLIRARSKGAGAHTQQGKMHTGPQDMTARLELNKTQTWFPFHNVYFFQFWGLRVGFCAFRQELCQCLYPSPVCNACFDFK